MSDNCKRILLVDDDPEIAHLIKRLLAGKQATDLKVEWVDTLKKAFNNLAENAFDLILLDLGLKESNGIATFKKMYKFRSDLPIVILTGSDEKLALEAIRLGAQEYLKKDKINGNMLVRVIRHTLERHTLQQESQKYAQQLQQSEERIRHIVEENVDGVIIVDESGIVKFVNPAVTQLLNRKSEEMIGEYFGFPVAGGTNSDLDIPGKKVKNVEMRVVETTWEGEKAFLASLRDVTERKEAENAIRESEEKFRAIAASATDAVVHIDNNGIILFWNKAAEIIFGYSIKEALGQELHEIIGPSKYHEKYKHAFKKFKETGKGKAVGKVRELTALHKNGKEFPVEVTFSAFNLNDEWQAAGTIRDITQRKKAEQNLLKTQQELEIALAELKANQEKLVEVESLKSVKELSGAISHEFSQPLQALSNYLDLIEKIGPRPEYFVKSKKMIQRVAHLMDELKHLSSLKRKNYINTQIIDLKASSTDAATEFENKILVVDDEEDILESIVEFFNISGYHCQGAENGKVALSLLKNSDYGLVISDIMMPVMSGPELFKTIKKNGYKGYFVFLTGYEIPGEKRDIVMKADALINKPVMFNELLSIVHKLLGEPVAV